MNRVDPSADRDESLWFSVMDWYQRKKQTVTPPEGFVQCAIDKFNQVRGSFDSFDPNPIQLKRLDPTIRENALRILNLTEDEAKISETVDYKYQFLTEFLNQRKSAASPIIARSFEELLQDADMAYKTLIKV